MLVDLYARWLGFKKFSKLPQFSQNLPNIFFLLDFTFSYRRCHEKTSYVSNYAFFTLMHKWVDRE